MDALTLRVAVSFLVHTCILTECVGNAALWMSSKKGHVECVRMLLKDPRTDPSYVPSLHFSSHFFIVIKKVYYIRDQKNLALFWAREGGSSEIEQELLKDSRVLFIDIENHK
jgi:hypothetical protein